MSRKDRSIAGFGDVAGRNEERTNGNVNIYDNINDNINVVADIFNKKPKKELVGIYFDPDVKSILQEMSKQGGRGVQSSIVNEAVSKLFKEKGLL